VKCGTEKVGSRGGVALNARNIIRTTPVILVTAMEGNRAKRKSRKKHGGGFAAASRGTGWTGWTEQKQNKKSARKRSIRGEPHRVEREKSKSPKKNTTESQ